MNLYDKQFVISSNLIKEIINYGLTLNDFLLLIYFINVDEKVFDILKIKQLLNLDEKMILEAFNNLTSKKLIELKLTNEDGQINEVVSLDKMYLKIDENLKSREKQSKKLNIFDVFEKEFERTLSPMEYEIINAWLDKNNSEEIIIGALKEATYNGVKSLRYIDKIIYEWSKQGFKTMEDVKKHLVTKSSNEVQEELFDYDWLDDND